MINGERVKQAREICGLTQAELAELVGVNQSNIARLERNAIEPHDDVIDSIAIRTRFPVSFFRQESGPEFPLGSLLYRRRTSLKSQQKARVHQLARLAFEFTQIVAEHFALAHVTLPRLAEDPTTAARLARSALGISPDTPINNIVNRLEKHGVIVLGLPWAIDEHDAFSLWADTDPRRPVIVMTSGKPGDRQRFTVAHELGHLVMHQSARGTVREIEDQAHAFACEFLLPEETMRQEIAPPVTLTTLAELKRRWGVSIQALVMRARSLRIITDRQRKYLFQQLGRRGWRKREPIRIPAEKPALLRRMIEELYGRRIDYKKLAADLSAPVSVVKELLVANGVNGPSRGHGLVEDQQVTDFPMKSRVSS